MTNKRKARQSERRLLERTHDREVKSFAESGVWNYHHPTARQDTTTRDSDVNYSVVAPKRPSAGDKRKAGSSKKPKAGKKPKTYIPEFDFDDEDFQKLKHYLFK